MSFSFSMNVIKCYYKDKSGLHQMNADPTVYSSYGEAILAVKTHLKQEGVPFAIRRRVLALVESNGVAA